MMGPSFPSSSRGNSSAARARLSISTWTVGGSGTIAVLLFVYGRYEVWLWDPFFGGYPSIAAIPGRSCWKKRAAGWRCWPSHGSRTDRQDLAWPNFWSQYHPFIILSHTKWTIPSNIIWSAHEDTISSRLEALQIFFSTTWEGRKAKAKGKATSEPPSWMGFEDVSSQIIVGSQDFKSCWKFHGNPLAWPKSHGWNTMHILDYRFVSRVFYSPRLHMLIMFHFPLKFNSAIFGQYFGMCFQDFW